MGIARENISDALQRLSQGLMQIYALRERKRLRQEEREREDRQFDWQQKKFYLDQEKDALAQRKATEERNIRFDTQQRNQAWEAEMDVRREERLGQESESRIAERKEPKPPTQFDKVYGKLVSMGYPEEDALLLASGVSPKQLVELKSLKSNQPPAAEEPSTSEWIKLWNAIDENQKSKYGNDIGVFKQSMTAGLNRKMVIGGVPAEEVQGRDINKATWNGYASMETAMKDLEEDLTKGLITPEEYDEWKRQIEGVFGK